MIVTIFGGSSPLPGSQDYTFAENLGRELALAGHTVMTGGYMGTMEAASKGAFEAGGHVIGVTCDEIENWRKRARNQWVKEERRLPTLHERMIELMDASQAAIALPGGPGTLAEIVLMWNRIQIDAMPKAPIILVGDGWKKVFETFFKEFKSFIPQDIVTNIKFAGTIDEILKQLPTK
jgi:uncharacterized protein (TIGR00730 family)